MKYLKLFEDFENEENEQKKPVINKLEQGMEITACSIENDTLKIETHEGVFEVDTVGDQPPYIELSGNLPKHPMSEIDDDPETDYSPNVSQFIGVIESVEKDIADEFNLIIITTKDGKIMKIYYYDKKF